MKCDVCKKEFSGANCPRCGFFSNYAATDEEGRKQLSAMIRTKREAFIRKYTAFSVDVLEASVRDINAPATDLRLVIADGKDCYGKICWDKSDGIAQYPDEAIPATIIHISYQYDGRERSLPVKIQPIRCNNYWHVGLKLEFKADFVLHVYLGTDEVHCAQAEVVLD